MPASLDNSLLPKHVRDMDPNILMSDNFVVLDCETTKIVFGDAAERDNQLLLTVTTKDGKEYKGFKDGEYHMERVLEMCERSDLIVGHNVKMELKWLSRCGLDLRKVMPYCTFVGEHVLAGNNTSLKKDLGSVATRYGLGSKEKYVDTLMKDKKLCTTDIPWSLLVDRCAKDVRQTYGTFITQRQLIAEQGLLPTMYTRMLMTPWLSDMEMQGMTIDPDVLLPRYEEVTERLVYLEELIAEITGGVNPNSPAQMAEFLYKTLKFAVPKDYRGKPMLTATGAPSTGKEAIGKLVAKTKRQKAFTEAYTEYALLDAEKTKALDKMRECVDAGDKLRFMFNQARTATHRLSSTGAKYGIQGQNMSRAHKKFFRASEDGWLISEADGAQIEFRVAVYLGQDRVGYDSLLNEEDVHSFTAKTLTDAGQPTTRQQAKADTFKPLFGGQSGTPAQMAYYKAFREKYPGITNAQETWKARVLRDKKLVTATGLTFHWPDTTVTRSGYITNSTNICNYPVQHLATGEIAPVSVMLSWHFIGANGMRARVVNSVHDSGAYEHPPEETDALRHICEQCFTTKVYEYMDKVYNVQFNVPLGTGFVSGTHWGQGDEIKRQVEPPFAPPGERAA